ncbi:MAG TPA: TetR/AcrR family transcriptional regulator [Candidatus Limnocylindria bacterium]|jgi:AcrR family transcriptional regulator|nr:TetR/AcrR family transcriptional regulator [Candidatus Limnocylindria bacterium]
MFETARQEHRPTERGDTTRDRILDTALGLFRKRGFEPTTMRDIARASKLSLGAAYYYFPSKEALVHAFYDRVQDEHATLLRATCASSADLVVRVRAALVSKLDVLREDRALLGALFRYVGERDHPLSVFSAATRAQREQAVAVFSLALEGSRLPKALHEAAARALWLAHLGLILYFIHDDSDEQFRTKRLARRTADVFCAALRLVTLPGVGRVITPALDALREAGLISAMKGKVTS